MQAFHKSFLVTLALAALLAACAAPQPSQDQVQSLVQTSVAATMQAQNQVGTFVAQTVAVQATATEADTPTTEVTASPFPTLTPIVPVIPTASLAPVSSGGGGSYSYIQPGYACDVITTPRDDLQYYRGEHFVVKFTFINTGTAQWCESNSCQGGPDFTFDSGTNFLSISGPIEIPALKSNATPYTIGPYGAVAPPKVGTYTMVWKLQGPICYAAIRIIVNR
ncbi:MAG TPA: hypothetical protein VLZ89_03415 [Anaerolineales bacterium]|nr:hypothetical protein [Anaerolineales bacterium]